ncbi:hypothetical protein SUGI_0234280 [Cryptomeria japonica]|uniref:uncharacterized protein LOC131074376 n=1 Tax=Cryptomeria japonica TaxID=3369 RepID=UPI002408ABE4|nr:uncharacterized protein LOC131074376 [Cryptomeria japonica]GLJ14488.1 hypothetical protein SUGI_0234280 [Cryptomeria japonica]
MATLMAAVAVSIPAISTPSSKYVQAFGCKNSVLKSFSVPANVTSTRGGERRLSSSFISSSSLKKFRSFSVQGETDSNSSVQEKAPFGYTRKDVLLIGLGVTVLGFGLKYGLEFIGVDSLKAGNVVQLVLVLGLTVGWILTYIFRVSTKDMTYAQQLRDYENKVLEKRLEELPEAELEVLLAQVEEEKQRLQNKNRDGLNL